MTDVFMRTDWIVRNLMWPPARTHTFSYSGPHDLKVTLRAPSPEEQEAGYDLANAMLSASSRLRASEANLAVLRAIESNSILGPDAQDQRVTLEYRGPAGVQIRLPSYSIFPQHFRSFIDGALAELVSAARKTVAAIRWRLDERGPHNPFSIRHMYWSFDQVYWHIAPGRTSVHGYVLHTLHVSDALLGEIETFVHADESVPVHDDLFREAWEQRFDNPRSSLVIGMAAAEIAMKRCIGMLVPHAEWLAMNLPSPPLAKMLSDYLPSLPARMDFDGHVKAPPPELLDTIKKGVSMRNVLSHMGTANVSVESVEEVLEAVRELIWLLEFYLGREWALTHLSHATREALNH